MATFGRTTTPGSNTSLSANFEQVGKQTLSEAGMLKELHIWINPASGSIPIRAIIYADNGSGSSGALVAVSAERTLTGSGMADQTFSITPVHLAAGTYWLGHWTSSAGGQLGVDTVTNEREYIAKTYSSSGAPNDPFGAGTKDNTKTEAYGVYDADPVNSVAPSVSGSAPVGSTLTTTDGTWSNSPTFTYAWTRDGSPIGGATSSTYTTVSADAGHAVGCTVTATNGVATASQASSNTVTVTAANTHRSTSIPQLRRHHTGRRGSGGRR